MPQDSPLKRPAFRGPSTVNSITGAESRIAHSYARKTWLEPRYLHNSAISHTTRQRFCQLIYDKLCQLEPQLTPSVRLGRTLCLELEIVSRFAQNPQLYNSACKSKIISLARDVKRKLAGETINISKSEKNDSSDQQRDQSRDPEPQSATSESSLKICGSEPAARSLPAAEREDDRDSIGKVDQLSEMTKQRLWKRMLKNAHSEVILAKYDFVLEIPETISASSISSVKSILKQKPAPNVFANEQMTCDRCGIQFTVASSEVYRTFQHSKDASSFQTTEGASGHRKVAGGIAEKKNPSATATKSSQRCNYHWGKFVRRRIGGSVERRRLCCDQPDDALSRAGCTEAPFHVIYLSDPVQLHRAIPFSSLGQCNVASDGHDTYATEDGLVKLKDVATDTVPEHVHSNKIDKSPCQLHAVALDCEMIYTSLGTELARISIMDAVTKEPILDANVKPYGEIIDLNTRYSGVTSLDDATMTLEDIRNKMIDLGITKDTLFIGHSIENDLKALRLVHKRVLDSAILYPHQAGPPYRNRLSDLSRKYLRRLIQQNSNATSGHDSMEDTKAALDLVLLKI